MHFFSFLSSFSHPLLTLCINIATFHIALLIFKNVYIFQNKCWPCPPPPLPPNTNWGSDGPVEDNFPIPYRKPKLYEQPLAFQFTLSTGYRSSLQILKAFHFPFFLSLVRLLTKYYRLCSLKNRNLFSSNWKLGSPRSRCRPTPCLPKALSWLPGSCLRAPLSHGREGEAALVSPLSRAGLDLI